MILTSRSDRPSERQSREYSRGNHHCTIDLMFDWFGISCVTTNHFCFYLQNTQIQTSQTGGQRNSNTSPFSIPWTVPKEHTLLLHSGG
jgi:hypothetical protein